MSPAMLHPLSPAQERLWLVQQLAVDSVAYVIPSALRLRGPLDPTILERCLQLLVARHEMLRARFVVQRGQPKQMIRPPAGFVLPITDLSHLRPMDARSAATALARELAARPFDLEHASPVRWALLRVASREHLLLMPMHHLVSDGYSIRLLHRELMARYAGATGGPRFDAGPQPARYVDVMTGEDDDGSALRHVLDHLSDAPPLVTLPLDRQRSPDPSFRGLVAAVTLDGSLQDEVAAICRRGRLTAFTVFCAAFHALLAGYGGDREIVMGFATANRRRAEARDVVGLFANTLVQRVSLAGNPSFMDLLQRVRDEVARAIDHDDVRFERVVQGLQQTRSATHHPVFQVLVDHYGVAPEPLRASELTAEPILVDNGSARVDLELRVSHDGPDVVATFKGNADVFDAATLERLADSFVTLLRTAVRDPHTSVLGLELTSASGRRRAREARNDAYRDYDLSRPVHVRVEERARRHPSRRAVTFGGRHLSYGELDARATALAWQLHGAGVRAGAVVGICVERSLELVIAVLATLKAGAAFLPLEPGLPPQRLAMMLEDARPSLIVASPETGRVMAAGAPPVVIADAGESRVPLPVPEPPLPRIGQDDLAYVIFTSGSTGRPKGAANTHGGLANRLLWMQEAMPIDASDIVLHKTPIGFDVSIWELLWPLCEGARMIVAPPDAHHDPDAIAAIAETEGVTVMHFVPSMLRAFVDAGCLRRCGALRHVVSSGEALTPQLRAAVLADTAARLHNLYGPSEAAIDVTYHPCDPGDDPNVVPIGRPIANTSAYVLDARMRQVPVGVAGELWIGGVGVGSGYVGDARLTAERFVPNPFVAPGDRLYRMGDRLYRTGDRARERSDGELEFLGRTDHQVKLRGFRIELGEVEAALVRVAGVGAAAVVLRDPGTPRARLVAYVVLKGAGDIQAELASVLPEYMRPSAIVELDELPLLASGKVDRSALPAPPRAVAAAPPSRKTARQTALARIWAATLDLDADGIDPDADFFALGGDSIRSIDLVVRARASGFNIAVADVFRHPRLHEQAALPRGRSAAVGELEPFSLIDTATRDDLPPDVEDAWPLSELLGALVAASRYHPGYRVYTTSVVVARGLDVDGLQAAVDRVVARHPFLRTSVRVDDGGEPLQLVHRDVPVIVDVRDVTGRPPPDQAAVLRAWLDEERCRTFNWSRPPLLRITAHRLTPDAYRLTLVEPFLDGWSVSVVLSEILSPSSDSDDAPRSTYAAFVAREREVVRSAEHRSFWEERLAGLPSCTIPVVGRPSARQARHRRLSARVDAHTSAALLALAASEAVPLKSVLLAAHLRVVAHLAGRDVAVTGVMANARPEHVGAVGAVGLFLNTTPVHVSLPGGTWRELVHAARAAEARTLDHRDYPYTRMVSDAGGRPLVSSTFNLTSFHAYRRLGGLVRDVIASDQTYFPLTAQFRRDVRTEAIRLDLELDPDSMDEGQPDRLCDAYARCLTAMANDPDARYEDVQLMGDADRALLRGPSLSRRETGTLDELFESRCAELGDAVAVAVGHVGHSYADLRAGAYRAAALLAAHGVRPGDRVALGLGRSLTAIEAILGSWLVGAAYVPVDPAGPAARRRRMLELSHPRVVVAEQPITEAGDVPVLSLGMAGDAAPASPPVRDATRTAVVLFTSGSTGEPKLVELSHAVIANRLQWMWDAHGFEAGEIVAHRTALTFVDSVTELLAGLLGGVRVAVAPPGCDDPEVLADMLEACGATRLTLVPSILRELLRLGPSASRRLAGLRVIVSSGEPLPATLALACRSALPGARLLNLYGSTEVCGDATAHLVLGDEEGGTIPIGTPIANVTAAVLDPWGRPSETAVGGRLAVGGACLTMTGIAMSDERMLTVPGVTAPMFLTGDLARRLPSGALQFAGRSDRQLNVRGVRIEPGEIEGALMEHPKVRAASVRLDTQGEESVLTAYVEADEPRPDAAVLRSHLRSWLAPAGIPSRFVLTSALPRTPSGKVNHAALASGSAAPAVRPSSVVRAPADEVERAIHAVWSARTAVPSIGGGDDLFELGAQSLDAIVVAARLSRHFSVRVTITDIFDNPTIAELARHVRDVLHRAGAAQET